MSQSPIGNSIYVKSRHFDRDKNIFSGLKESHIGPMSQSAV